MLMQQRKNKLKVPNTLFDKGLSMSELGLLLTIMSLSDGGHHINEIMALSRDGKYRIKRLLASLEEKGYIQLITGSRFKLLRQNVDGTSSKENQPIEGDNF